jgi:5-oxoprolinase (ATP-hydrolysing)
MASGGAGQIGHNYVLRKDGTRVDLAGTGRVEMAAGDVFVIDTPGGGGFGRAGESREAAE